MTYKITNSINRISFHDSHIINSKLANNLIVLSFDWAKLDDYKEENLPSLILGDCVLKLNEIRHSSLAVETIKGKISIEFPNKFPEQFEEILKNVSLHDNEISFEGFTTIDGIYQWTIWKLDFESFEFTWDRHITADEWKKGKVV